MSNNSPTNHLPEGDGAVLEVTDYLVGQQIIDVLRRAFASNGIKQCGDFYMDQSAYRFGGAVKECLTKTMDQDLVHHIIAVGKQNALDRYFAKVQCNRARNDGRIYDYASDSGVRKFVKAIKYKRRSKEAYKTVIQ
jgi:hypothetical protein